MSTRGLIAVITNGECKVAQYCQYDSYPAGQGSVILEFLKDKFDSEKFLERLDHCQYINDSNEIHDFAVTTERDAYVLELIQDSTDDVFLIDSFYFLKDYTNCSWYYVLNMDEEVLEVYKNNATDKQLVLVHTFSFHYLPDEEMFIDICDKQEGVTIARDVSAVIDSMCSNDNGNRELTDKLCAYLKNNIERFVD